VALAYLKGVITQTSFINGVDDVFVAAAAFTVMALIPAVLLKRSSAPAGAQRAPLAE